MLTLSRYVKAGSAWTRETWFKVADGVTELDFSGVEGYEPIGTGNGFQSTFDGNGVIVKNLTVSGKDYVGLFGIVTGGQGISNIRIDGSCSFTGTGNYVGAVVGYVNNPSASLSNCHNDGADVTGTAYVGGIMGGYYRNFYGMSDCSAGMRMEKGTRMTVSATSYVGAMMGNAGGTMTNNWYNGITVVVKAGDKEYTGFGYGRQLSDAAGIRSATGGAFPKVNPGHNELGLTWSYDLYTNTFTVVGDPDPGYVITSVTVSYTDADGNAQTVTRNEEQIAGSRSFDVPLHPTGVTATYYGVLRPADETKAVSATNPYLIHNVQDMLTLSRYVKAGSAWTVGTWFRVADGVTELDFSGVEGYEPIGTGKDFQSNFDGNGVTVKNLTVSGKDNVGLFGSVVGSMSISNIRIDGSCSFTGTGNYVGAVVGYVYSASLSNCHNDGADVTGTSNVGGIMGGFYQYFGGMSNCSVGMRMEKGTRMTVSGNNRVGAVAGYAGGAMTNNWYNGMTVVVQAGNNYYTGHGYGINLADNNNALSMTGGYCGVTNENNGRNVEWEYDPWSKEFVVSGYGAITNSTSGIAPDIIKDDIESLIISSGITGIGSLAFSGWTSLNSITFDGCSLTSAANDAFDGCRFVAVG